METKLVLKYDDDRMKVYTPDETYLGTIVISKYSYSGNDIVLYTKDSDWGDESVAYFPRLTTRVRRK